MSWMTVGLWRMLTDWLDDPQRRWQILWKVVEDAVAIVVALAIFWTGMRKKPGRKAAVAIAVAALAVGVVAGWLTYEFILEPLGLAGPYWERTPVPGTTFRHW